MVPSVRTTRPNRRRRLSDDKHVCNGVDVVGAVRRVLMTEVALGSSKWCGKEC